MLEYFLAFHLFGALGVFLLLLRTFQLASLGKIFDLPKYAKGLSVGLVFEIATGSAMSILSTSPSLIIFCQNIALYSGVIFIALFLIHKRLVREEKQHLFPLRFVRISLSFAALVTLPAFSTLLA